MAAATANTGFFQTQPTLQNQVTSDVSYRRILNLFVPKGLLEQIEPELAKLGQDVLAPEIFDWITDAERNLPYLRGSGRDPFGVSTSELVTGEGWRKLQEFGIRKGMVAYNYDTNHAQYSRVIQMLRVHLWGGSNANTMCPGAMTDGACRLIQKHLSKSSADTVFHGVLQIAYDHLTSRDPLYAWTSGQWMTERKGGSDVSLTETIATFTSSEPNAIPLACPEEHTPLGPWSISGFKFFSSATDANMTVLLACTSGTKGPSAFIAPMRRARPPSPLNSTTTTATQPNGVRIQRLKDKLGTRPVPTAELELVDMRGWLLGEEGRGVHELATVLTITRVHCSTGCLGYLARGLAIARAYALVRCVGDGKGKGEQILLYQNALYMRTLADLTVEYHGMNLLLFYTVYVLGLDESASLGRGRANLEPPASKQLEALTPPSELVSPLLRVLSSLHKGYICKQSVPALHACMEALGGVGYLSNSESEPMNVSRLFRDGCVNAIWEGTTDVISTDFLRALKHPVTGPKSIEALNWLLKRELESLPTVCSTWMELKKRIEEERHDELLPVARDVMFRVAEMLIVALMVVDSRNGGSTTAPSMCDRFMMKKGFSGTGSEVGPTRLLGSRNIDIVYGTDGIAPKL